MASIENEILSPADKAVKEREAAKRLAELRYAVARFNRLRARTAEVIEGKRKASVMGQQAVDVIARTRDPEREVMAATGMRDLMRLVLEREPQLAEMLNGPPDVGSGQLGALPIIVLAAVAGGAVSLTSLFNYLSAREETAQRELGMRHSFWDVAGDSAPYLVPVGTVVLVAGGLYVLYLHLSGRPVLRGVTGLFKSSPKRKRAAPKKRSAARLPPKRAPRKEEPEEEEEEEEEE